MHREPTLPSTADTRRTSRKVIALCVFFIVFSGGVSNLSLSKFHEHENILGGGVFRIFANEPTEHCCTGPLSSRIVRKAGWRFEQSQPDWSRSARVTSPASVGSSLRATSFIQEAVFDSSTGAGSAGIRVLLKVFTNLFSWLLIS